MKFYFSILADRVNALVALVQTGAQLCRLLESGSYSSTELRTLHDRWLLLNEPLTPFAEYIFQVAVRIRLLSADEARLIQDGQAFDLAQAKRRKSKNIETLLSHETDE